MAAPSSTLCILPNINSLLLGFVLAGRVLENIESLDELLKRSPIDLLQLILKSELIRCSVVNLHVSPREGKRVHKRDLLSPAKGQLAN